MFGPWFADFAVGYLAQADRYMVCVPYRRATLATACRFIGFGEGCLPIDRDPGITPPLYSCYHENLFSRDPEIIDFWGLGGPETTPKGGALRAPPFGVVWGVPGAVQTPNIDDFWVPEK